MRCRHKERNSKFKKKYLKDDITSTEKKNLEVVLT